MTFPVDVLDVRTELLIGVVWTDITDDVYTRSPITIERGRKDEGTRTDPTKVSLQLNNRLGKYSPRNPLSPYYGLIGRNTPIRISVPGPESYLSLSGEAADLIATPDNAALDITGDIDIRVEATADWYVARSQSLIGKWSTTDGQRSYVLRVFNGSLIFNWTTAGTDASALFHMATIPGGLRRAAFRVTLDVNNGSGGRTSTLYWAESLDGPWTTLSTVTTAGTTSIFSSTTALQIAPGIPTTSPVRTPIRGRVHRAEIRSGIDGSAVANPDFRSLPEGTTSFADPAGRTWTLAGAAEITDREYRAHAEVSSWPARWDVSGEDVYVPIEAAGIQRRMGQGKKPLASTLRRRIPSGGPLAYWPLEEGKDATQAYSTLPGVAPLNLSGLDFEANDTLAGSSALPALRNPARIRGTIPRSTASGWQVEFVYKLDTMPGSQTEIMRVTVAGSTMRTAIVYASTAGIRIEARDTSGDVLAFFLFNNATALADFVGVWNRLALFVSDAGGGQTNLCANWRDITNSGGTWTAATIYTGVPGAAVGVAADWAAATEGMAIGHLAAFDVAGSGTSPGVTIYEGADDGFAGETALGRLDRLAREEPGALDLVWVDGDVTRSSELMGPQRPAPLMDLLEEVPASDGGILYEHRERLGLVYRDRSSLENQAVALALDYEAPGEVGPPLEPVEDDQRLRNDVTVKRDGGSEGRAVLEEGPMSVLPPEDGGVGPYEESVTLSLALDAQTQQIAGWRMALGTWDEARYPTVHVMLHAAPHLIPDALLMDLGDRLTIDNPPAWLPPDTIDQLVQGYTEVLDQYTWDLWFNCAPAGPWTVGVLEDDALGRLDTDGSELTVAVDSDDTSWSVLSNDCPRWITTADFASDFPFDVRAGGEVVTVSACASSVSDTFTRSVTDGWGSATSGQAWTNAGGTAANFDVTGSAGTHTMTSTNVSRRSSVPATSPDFDMVVDLTTNDLASGGSQFAGLMARAVDSDNLYMARLELTTAAAVILTIRKRVAAAEATVGSSFTTALTHVAGTYFRLRFQGFGSTLRARAWLASGTEPDYWQVVATDTDLAAAGTLGMRSILASTNTDTNPIVSYDNFAVLNPQTLTISQRSVNGISKSHALGTALALANPLRLAL
ncbi:hypothetical protein [Streptomyces marianii]|uniref:Uncharacterized protein n=1 Tax=Streptomyces marianii TaxID=1817406 RepID=A0A5R9EA61_9ACTN|nr:hypothetical protein [Streptomyces marianii]TLQ45749.1 hypothetical protein FEF34_24605 [Streptomyces marianii]